MSEVSEKSDAARREEEVLAFWSEHRTFKKSLEKPSPQGEFVFYDGPPFATGLPHYGHLLAGTIKDVLPRYKTMRGFRVVRRWGWDCHGLPIENLIEKELGLKNKKDIEELGVEKFNAAARDSVLRYADEWKKTVPRFGRWVDMDDDYRTMDPAYTESVWWIFAELYRTKRAYEGFKVMPFCPRCGTTLSNFEVALGYKDIVDLAVTVQLPLVDEPGSFLLAWTTTPWTLPGNMAAAVNGRLTYAAVRTETGLFYVLKDRINHFFEHPVIEREVLGSELVGKAYTPPFEQWYQEKEGVQKEKFASAWKVYAADFVTAEDGTGIVHVAPAFGGDDLELAQVHGIPVMHHVAKDGAFAFDPAFDGRQAKPKDDHQASDVEIIKYLAHHGVLFKKEKITHSYPHCWRCETPLLNYATTSWFVSVSKFKDQLVALNNTISWLPKEVGEKRFGNWLAQARDWAISRPRFWGAPFPVWKHPETGAVHVFSSLKELSSHIKKSGNTYLVMRHGEAETNVKGIISGSETLYHLTERGRAQVLESAEKLSGRQVDLIITSPMLRTLETAEIVRAQLGLSPDQVIIDPRIREINPGAFEGRSVLDYREAFPERADFLDTAPEGGETKREVRQRVGEFIYDLEARYQGKTILIVSHGSPTWTLQAVQKGLSRRDRDEFDRIPYFSFAEVREFPFVPLPHNREFELDVHRPYIDDIEVQDAAGERLVRIPDVFDSWFESGSMPYASQGYPHTHDASFNPRRGLFARQRGFPAHFIAEGLDQTRGWFYSLLVLGSALFKTSPYQNVIVNGLILAEDGKKMSKSLKNYPDPMEVVNRYGADAVRAYMLSSPVVRGEDLRFVEKDVADVSSKLVGRLANVLSLYELYRDDAPHGASSNSPDVLDQWVLSRLGETTTSVQEGLDRYELDRATRALLEFVDDLSTWYVRRSRDRLKRGDESAVHALSTLRFVLREYAKVSAPITPFMSEYVYRRVRSEADPESVHLCDWPRALRTDHNLVTTMSFARSLVSLGLMARTEAGIKVRQPLASVAFKHEGTPPPLWNEAVPLIADELNVKEVVLREGGENNPPVTLDTTITPALQEEGEVRELIRTIQDLRKEAGLMPKDQAVLVFSGDRALLDRAFAAISKATNVVRVEEGTATHVKKL